MLSRITSSWVFSTSKDRDTIISLGNLFPARDHPHSRKLHVVFIRRYRDSIEESVSDWFSSCSVWIGSTWRTLWGTYLQLCSLCGYSTNCPRKPNCWQQPAVHTNQEHCTQRSGCTQTRSAVWANLLYPKLCQTPATCKTLITSSGESSSSLVL